MRARVEAANGFEAAGGEAHGARRVGEQRAQVRDHIGGVASKQEVAAGPNEVLPVVPRPRDHRDAAGHRFERADGRDAGEGPRVWPPRNVDRHAILGEHFGDAVVRQPAAVLDPSGFELFQRGLRVADAVDAGLQPERPHGADEELADLLASFVVAPVTDPHEVAALAGAVTRVEDARVGRFVPGPRLARPAVLAIQVADDAAVRQYAVVPREIVFGHGRSIGDAAMVRIVEVESVVVPRPMLADAPDELVRVPLVHDCDIRTVQRPIEVHGREVVELAADQRVGGLEAGDRRVAMLRTEILETPAVAGFENADLVAARDQLGRDAAQEMGVPVVPVRNQRVGKVYAAHTYASMYSQAIRRGVYCPACWKAASAIDWRYSGSAISWRSAPSKSSSSRTNTASSPQTSRRLGISPSTRAHPERAASSAESPKGS